jgi:hypothetical protein
MKLLTNVVDTYGGQVIQILGVKVGQLTINGQFGKEGPWGVKKGSSSRPGWENISGWVPKDPNEVWDYGDSGLGIGLTEMTSFFRDYFQQSTQGGNANVQGRYEQEPMIVTYDPGIAHMENADDTGVWSEWKAGSGQWLVIPTSFPSYRRSNENFAPEWQVTAEIVQAPLELVNAKIEDAINRLQRVVGYDPLSPWSAPDSEVKALSQITRDANLWHQMLPRFTVGDVSNLIYFEASAPNLIGVGQVGDTAEVSGGTIDTGGIPRNPPGT